MNKKLLLLIVTFACFVVFASFFYLQDKASNSINAGKNGAESTTTSQNIPIEAVSRHQAIATTTNITNKNTTISPSSASKTATSSNTTHSITDVFDGQFLNIVGYASVDSKPAIQYQVQVLRRIPSHPNLGTAQGSIIVSVPTSYEGSLSLRGEDGIFYTVYDSIHKWYELDSFTYEIFD